MFSFFVRLKAAYGLPFLLYLVFSQLVLKGMFMRLSMGMMLPLFKSLGIDATTFQIYMTVAMVPWTVKPFIGLLSDMVTFKGYNKRYWILVALGVGALGAGMLFGAYTLQSVPWMLACFVCLQFAIAVTDLLTEGKYSELMRENPTNGSDIITFVNGLQTGGSILAMLFIGPMADRQMWYPLLTIGSILIGLPFIPTWLGWLPETKHGDKWFTWDTQKWRKDRSKIMVVAFAGKAGPLVAIAAALFPGKPIVSLVIAGILLVASLASTFWAFPRVVALVATYQVLAFVSKPSMGGALDYFYTADQRCLLDGPHFDWAYYLTYTGLVGALVSFGAVWIYQLWLSGWRFRNVLTLTTILVGCGGIMDLIIVLRLNVTWFGIPDHWFYLFGEAVLETVVAMLYWIPSSAIISKVVPKGMESSCFALMAGLSNFARMFSDLLGATIFHAAGVHTTPIEGGYCNFENMWWLVFLFHIITPILIGVPATLLVPNCYQTDIITADGEILRNGEPEAFDLSAFDEMEWSAEG